MLNITNNTPGDRIRTPGTPVGVAPDRAATSVGDTGLVDLLGALAQVGGLKDLRRTGWLRVGLGSRESESVADHSFRAATLALMFGGELGVDVGKLVKMVLVHDLAESDPAVGDITPYDGIDRLEKFRRERVAMEGLCERLPNGAEMLGLWLDYAEERTPEARIAHELDALEMALTAREYQDKLGADLSEFRASARKKIRHPELLRILDKLV